MSQWQAPRVVPNWQETEPSKPKARKKFQSNYVRRPDKDSITPDEACRLMRRWGRVC